MKYEPCHTGPSHKYLFLNNIVSKDRSHKKKSVKTAKANQVLESFCIQPV